MLSWAAENASNPRRELVQIEEKSVSKRPPELTWQDKAILVVIPLVVLVVFFAANYLSKDLSINEAFDQKMEKTVIRDGGYISEILPPEATASATQKCRLRSREGNFEFLFKYNVQGSQTMDLQIGRLMQFFGEYRYDPKGGTVEVPFKGKSGKWTGWAVYENHRYFSFDDEEEKSQGNQGL